MVRILFLSFLSFLISERLFGQEEFFVSLSPSSGNLSKINSLRNVKWILPQLNTYSQAQHRYYFCGGYDTDNWRLYTVDAYSGNVIDSPLLSNVPKPDNIFAISYNDADNILYGILWSATQKMMYFISLNPTSGSYDTITRLPSVSAAAANSMIDNVHGRFMFYGFDTSHHSRIYSISISGGTLLSDPLIPDNISQLKFDNATGQIYGVSASIGSPCSLVSIDPSTGVCNKVSIFENIKGLYGIGQFFTYDDTHKNYFFVGMDGSDKPCLVTVNTVSGVEISRPYFPHVAANGDNVICFQYDNQLDKLFAIHWQEVREDSKISVYPNPFRKETTVHVDAIYDKLNAVLYGEDGKRIVTVKSYGNSKIRIVRDNLPQGNYYLKVFNDNTLIGCTKLIVD